METWKSIEGTNGRLEVSDQGRIRSLLRGHPYVLKAQTDNKGYQRISVTLDRVKIRYKVHRAVAMAFIPNPDRLPQVNHKDGDKTNNAVSNLEWCTNKENCHHAIANGLWPQAKYFNGSRPNATNRQRSLRTEGWNNPNPPKPIIGYHNDETKHFASVYEAELFLDSRHISDVLKGKRKYVKGWTFAYAGGGEMRHDTDHTGQTTA